MRHHRPLSKCSEGTFNYSCNITFIGHVQREIAVTLSRNIGHASAKSPVTMARNTHVGEMFLADTRHLPPGVAALFNGVRKTKEGIDILLASKEKAADQLGRFLGAFKDRDINVSVTMPTTAALEEIFHRTVATAHERQRRIDEDRRGLIEGTLTCDPE